MVLRVLVSAYACEPDRGSEGEIAWGVVVELAKENQVWVLTRANNKVVHDNYFSSLATGKPVSLNFIYYDLPSWVRFYKRGKRNFLIYYYHWQLASWRAAKQVCIDNDVQVIHHLTGGMEFFPSGLSFLDYPFVFGPVGGEDTHPAILKGLSFEDKIKELKRVFQRYLLRNFDPFIRFTYSRANRVIKYSSASAKSSNDYFERVEHKLTQGKQTGLIFDERYRARPAFCEKGDVFTVLYAANLIPWKGGRFVVDAFEEFHNRGVANVRLVVVGSGPLLEEMTASIDDSGLSHVVDFVPWLPMQELIDFLPQADVFLYPTYHHGLATICLQAMYMGLPMICLAGDGIETALKSGGGIVVDFDSFEEIPINLADAIYTLYQDEDLRQRLAEEAKMIVEREFNYELLTRDLLVSYKAAVSDYNP
jgi:glycosyltransferase involved in cell wall biosynthesis